MRCQIMLIAAFVGLLMGEAWCAEGDPLRDAKAWKTLQEQVQSNVYSVDNVKVLGEFIRTYPESGYVPDARFNLAEIAFRNGDYKRAWPQYKTLADHRNSAYNGAALLRLGEINYNSRNIKTARGFFGEVDGNEFRGSVLSAEAQYGLILCDLHEKDYEKAGRKLGILVNMRPALKSLAKIRELIGIVRFQEKKFQEALEALEDLSTPTAGFYRGLSNFHLTLYLEAADSFGKLSVESEGSYAEMGAYFKAESFRMAGNNILALQAYDQFIKRYPDSRMRPYALIQLARSLMNSRQFDAAMKILNSVKKAPNVSKNISAYAMYLEASSFGKSQDYIRAVAVLDSALTNINKTEYPELFGSIYVAKGYYLLKLGNSKGASLVIDRLVREMPYHPLGMPACMIVGNAAYLDRNWNSAISAYETALLNYKYSKLSDVALAMLLRTYYQAGRPQELVTNANRIMKSVVEDFPAQDLLWRTYAYFIVGEAYYKIGQYANASEYYRKAVRQPTWAPLARLYLAWSLYHEGKYDEAVSLAKQVSVSADGTDNGRAGAAFLTAACFFNQKRYDAAINSFRAFRKRFPNDEHVPESYFQEGVAARQMGYFKNALRIWGSLTERFPNDPLAQEAQLNMGRLYFQGRKYGDAVKTFADFLKKWPGTPLNAEAHWMTAQSQYNSKGYQDAIPLYSSFLQKYPNDPRVDSCKEQLMLSYYNRAIAAKDPGFLAHFVLTYPKSSLAADAQYMLGYIAYEKKDWSGAVRKLRELLLDYPGTAQAPTALLAIARSLEHIQDLAGAAEEYESVIMMFPATTYAQDAAMRLGAIYFSQEKFNKAAERFSFLASHAPDGPVRADALFNVAVSYSRANALADAVQTYEAFASTFENDPRRIDALLEIAVIHKESENYFKMLEAYQRVLETKHEKVTSELRIQIYNQMGDVWSKPLNNKEKAVVAYSQLISMKPAKHELRLVGLAQLAAIYEEDEKWENALMVYGHISRSDGRADWVKTAVARTKEIKEYLKAKKGAAPAANE